MTIGYVRETWWARNRTYIGCLVGVIGAMAAITALVLAQTDVQVYGPTLGGTRDCGTLFSPVASSMCSGAHGDELVGVILSAAVLAASVVGVVVIARTRPRRSSRKA